MNPIDVKTDITGSVWKIVAKVGDQLAAGDEILIMESMKIEIPVAAPAAGIVAEILAEEGTTVQDGAVVARLRV
jgi:acetyl-CoA carboxylase biotin carboxyl carrier protein